MSDDECKYVWVPETHCGITFGGRPSTATRKRHTRELGTTVRGELMIADCDDEGRIYHIELVSGAKPCQASERSDNGAADEASG